MTRYLYIFLFLCVKTFVYQGNILVTAQSCGRTRERWAWTDHTCREQNEFLEAVYSLKQNGIYDEFVEVHQSMNSISHGVAEFLPWHRWFLYIFEDALREVSGNPCMTIPYWDWEDSTVFDEDTFDWFNGIDESTGACRWETQSGACLRRDMNQRVPLWRSGQVLAMIMNYDQYADGFSWDSRRNNGFRAALEGGPHSAPHEFLGGPMLEASSPSDPLFFLHHANVDRIWSLWQDYYDHDQLDVSLYDTTEHYEGGRLDVPMRFARNWMFTMENGRFPTPRDIISNNRFVNVLYKNDQLARRLRYNPNPEWVEPAAQGYNDVWCDREWDRKRKNRALQSGVRSGDPHPWKDTEELPQKQKIEVNASPSVSTSLRGGSSVGSGHFKIETNFDQQELSKFSIVNTVENCLEMNEFWNENERDIWERQCQNLPLTTTLAKRMELLAKEECDERQNPYSASPEFIRKTNMSNEIVAFECFHSPDSEN